MIRLNQIKINVISDNHESILDSRIKQMLKINSYLSYEIVKRSIDARRKPELYWVYTVDVAVNDENKVLKKSRCKNATISSDVRYRWPAGEVGKLRPVIIGMGPAGLFCGYMLAKAGDRPIICERGRDVDTRTEDVTRFWETGELNLKSNVQFGEGGAGAFSDGKLTTLVNDKTGRNKEVLKILVENGAPENILYDSKPHIGTDVLKDVVKNIRKAIIAYGGEVRFDHRLIDINNPEDGILEAVFDNGSVLTTDALVLAIGHSARDTFEMLSKKAIIMTPKPFAVGMRVQHPQSLIDSRQYGEENLDKKLPASSYKLTFHDDSGRGVYSFCMCPGGYVVNASSEPGRLAINGMSYNDRDSGVANSAIIVTVTPTDFPGDDPLSGVEFQRRLEEKAYNLANGLIPYESFKEYKNRQTDDTVIDYRFKGKAAKGAVHELLPEEVSNAFINGMEYFGTVIKGFADDNAVIAGIESRTSSPVRIERDDTYQAKIKGLYPCGEGAGYAGGIMSAAMDGMLIAEEIWKR